MVSAQTFTVEFTRTELDATPAKGKNGMAPGLDGVTQEMLTNISPNTKDVDKRCTVEGMANGSTY